MSFQIKVDNVAGRQFEKNFTGLREKFAKAFTAAANMAASMIEQAARADIVRSGMPNMASSLQVKAEGSINNMRISMTIGDPRAALFETGGTVHGKPLLWLPLSGTSAEGIHASEFPDKLFSAKSKTGLPLLFSIADKSPKYFGVEQVTIPRKFHLKEVQASVMANFRQIFDTALKGQG